MVFADRANVFPWLPKNENQQSVISQAIGPGALSHFSQMVARGIDANFLQTS
jgi:hypothetical protein